MKTGFKIAMMWLIIAIQVVLVIIITTLLLNLEDGLADRKFYFNVLLPFFIVVIALQLIPVLQQHKWLRESKNIRQADLKYTSECIDKLEDKVRAKYPSWNNSDIRAKAVRMFYFGEQL